MYRAAERTTPSSDTTNAPSSWASSLRVSRRFGSTMRLLSWGWPYNGSRIMGLECLRTASESPTTKRVPILRPSLPSRAIPAEAILLNAPGMVIVRQIFLEAPQVEPELGSVAHKVFFAEFALTLVEEVVHLPEAALRGCCLCGLSGTASTGVRRVEREVSEDEAHLLTYPLLQLLEHGMGLSAIGTFVVAILQKRHRRVLRPARMVSCSDRLQTIAFPASHHVVSPSLRSFEPQVAIATRCHFGTSRQP